MAGQAHLPANFPLLLSRRPARSCKLLNTGLPGLARSVILRSIMIHELQTKFPPAKRAPSHALRDCDRMKQIIATSLYAVGQDATVLNLAAGPCRVGRQRPLRAAARWPNGETMNRSRTGNFSGSDEFDKVPDIVVVRLTTPTDEDSAPSLTPRGLQHKLPKALLPWNLFASATAYRIKAFNVNHVASR